MSDCEDIIEILESIVSSRWESEQISNNLKMKDLIEMKNFLKYISINTIKIPKIMDKSFE